MKCKPHLQGSDSGHGGEVQKYPKLQDRAGFNPKQTSNRRYPCHSVQGLSPSQGQPLDQPEVAGQPRTTDQPELVYKSPSSLTLHVDLITSLFSNKWAGHPGPPHHHHVGAYEKCGLSGLSPSWSNCAVKRSPGESLAH